MRRHIFEYLWFLGFKLFCELAHPRIAPLIALRSLVRRASVPEASAQPMRLAEAAAIEIRVPRKIWMYWAQGWESAPPLVLLCRDSWIEKNPGWEVVVLDESNINDYATVAIARNGKNIPHAAYSDIVRMQLLAQHGGVWADATLLCAAPLDSWLPRVLKEGFFAFEKSKTTLASWFLVAEEGNTLIRRWNDSTIRYWRTASEPGRYFWLHYLFEYLLLLEPSVRRIWEGIPKISSKEPYAMRDCLREGDDSQLCVALLKKGEATVHKLDWRMKIDEVLLDRFRAQLFTRPPQ